MSSYVERIVRAARLDPQLYEEVEADQSAMGQAMGVVVLASVAAGIGMGGMGLGEIVFVTIARKAGCFWQRLSSEASPSSQALEARRPSMTAWVMGCTVSARSHPWMAWRARTRRSTAFWSWTHART